jgi:hypothetical protein
MHLQVVLFPYCHRVKTSVGSHKATTILSSCRSPVQHLLPERMTGHAASRTRPKLSRRHKWQRQEKGRQADAVEQLALELPSSMCRQWRPRLEVRAGASAPPLPAEGSAAAERGLKASSPGSVQCSELRHLRATPAGPGVTQRLGGLRGCHRVGIAASV